MRTKLILPVLLLGLMSRLYGEVSFQGVECDQTHCKGDVCINATCPRGCKDGYFGSGCIYNCNNGCLHHKCNDSMKGIGICTDGCIPGNWGETCNSPCPYSCKTCVRLSGKTCSSCPEFHYGPACRKYCRASCPNTGCNIDGGCKKDLLACGNGKFGSDCQFGCSTNCLYATCNRTSGICLHGCKQGYFGHICGLRCNPQCKKQICNYKGECTEGCEAGYYGDYCELQCVKHCRFYSCDHDTGDCSNGCSDGYYGDQCNMTCFAGCSVCHGRTGECLKEHVIITSTNLTVYYVLGSVGMLVLCGIIVAVIVKRRCSAVVGNRRPNSSRKLPDPPAVLYQYEYNEINEEEMNPSNQRVSFITPGPDTSSHLSLEVGDTSTSSGSPTSTSQPAEESHVQSDTPDQTQNSRRGCQAALLIDPKGEVVLDNFLYKAGLSKVDEDSGRDRGNSKYLSAVRTQGDEHSIQMIRPDSF